MATLTRRTRWEPYAPNLGDNLELPEAERLTLEVATGLTKQQLLDLGAATRELKWGDGETLLTNFVNLLGPYVRVVGTHTIEGKPVTTLAELLALVVESPSASSYFLLEVTGQLMEANSVSGGLRLFSLRRSGGGATTAAQSAAKTENPTAGQAGG